MAKDRDGENFIFKIKAFMRGIGKKIKCTDMEVFIIAQENQPTKVTLLWINSKAMANFIMKLISNPLNLTTTKI